MKIHFVYAFAPDNQELRSPFCITRNLYKYLNERADIKYYQWDQKGVADVQPDDVFIGHPHYERDTIVQRTMREKKCKVMCTIHPLHTALPEHNMPFDDLTKKADKVFNICGPYWTDTIDQTCFAHWKPKIIRLDMAVEPNNFPYLRSKFNDPGKRRLVYIGSSMPMKNLGYMVALMKSMPDVGLDWYGGDGNHPLAKLPNVSVVGNVTLNPTMAKKIIDKSDIFINTSNSDANPTTLLEAMAWGLITACTKQSGYWKDPLFTEMYLDNLPKTERAIRDLLTAPSQQLLERADQGRREIETKYTWDRFCSTVWDGLQELHNKDT